VAAMRPVARVVTWRAVALSGRPLPLPRQRGWPCQCSQAVSRLDRCDLHTRSPHIVTGPATRSRAAATLYRCLAAAARRGGRAFRRKRCKVPTGVRARSPPFGLTATSPPPPA